MDRPDPLGDPKVRSQFPSLRIFLKHDRTEKSSRLHDVIVSIGMVIVTLVGLEIFLRIADFKEFRDSMSERSLGYGYDFRARLGAGAEFVGRDQDVSTTQYKHNSMGLRDEEFTPDARPTIMFLGDPPSSGASISRPASASPSC